MFPFIILGQQKDDFVTAVNTAVAGERLWRWGTQPLPSLDLEYPGRLIWRNIVSLNINDILLVKADPFLFCNDFRSKTNDLNSPFTFCAIMYNERTDYTAGFSMFKLQRKGLEWV